MKNKTGVLNIDKKLFIEIMANIKKHDELDRYNTDLFQKIFKNDFITGCDDNILNNELLRLLKKAFNDTGEWIEYFIYELKWGSKYTEGCVTDEGKNCDISTESLLYDFLIKNMNE